jgi:hypothetical protein
MSAIIVQIECFVNESQRVEREYTVPTLALTAAIAASHDDAPLLLPLPSFAGAVSRGSAR